MENLEGKTVKELREIAKALGINYVGERKKAELIEVIRHQQQVYSTPIDRSRKVLGYYLDGSPIYEETTPKSDSTQSTTHENPKSDKLTSCQIDSD